MRPLGFPPWQQFGKKLLAACMGLTSYFIYIFLSMLLFMDIYKLKRLKTNKIKADVKYGEVKRI
jgi:hypothetical protein